MQFSEQLFRKRFKELDEQNEGRLPKAVLSKLLQELDMEQHSGSIDNAVRNFEIYAKRYEVTSSKLAAKNIEKDEEDEEQEAEPEEPQIGFDYKLNLQESLKYVDFLQNKIKFQIWKKTCVLLELQYYMTHRSNRDIYPLKDPAQQAKVNVLVGKLQKHYNSNLSFTLLKKPSASAEPVFLELNITTLSQENSNTILQLWKGIHEMITALVEEELPGGAAFLETIKISAQATNTHFVLRVESNNPDVNEFVKTFSDMGDIIFKTTLKLKLAFSLDFNFDLGHFISNPAATFYDFLANNIKIAAKFQGSEYVTALKELMIANKAFEDLSYVADDPFSLGLIALVNAQSANLNLTFSNDFASESEQDSLREILGMLQGLSSMIPEYEEKFPELIKMVKELLRFSIEARLKAYDFEAQLALKIPNLDQLIFKPSVLLGTNEEEEMDS